MKKTTIISKTILLVSAASLLFACSKLSGPYGAHQLTGIVIDEKNGRPCDSVTVGLLDKEPVTMTGVDGRFTIHGLPAGSIVMRFSKERYLGAFVPMDLQGDEGLVAIDTVFLVWDHAILTGRVLRADDSMTPVVHAKVLSIDTGAAFRKDSATTDTTGFFILPHCMPDKTPGRRFLVTCEGYAPDSFTQALDAGDSVHKQVYLRAYTPVTGRVVEADSVTPIPDVKVYAGGDSVQTDAAGAFTLAHLFSSNEAQQFAFVKDFYEGVVVAAVVQSGGDTLKSVVMQRTKGAINGSVILQGQKNMAGAVVTVTGTGFRDTTDSAGFYEVPVLPTGLYDMTMEKKNYYSRSRSIMVLPHQTTVVDFYAIVQSGAIVEPVGWFGGSDTTPVDFFIHDTLIVAAGGALVVHAGARVNMGPNARIVVEQGGILRTVGEHNRTPDEWRFAEIRAAGVGAGITIPVGSNSLPDMFLSRFTNISITGNNGLTAERCLFLSAADTQSSPLLSVASSGNQTVFANCDFVRINSNREAITLQDSLATVGATFTNCIFYARQDAALDKGFLKSENASSGGPPTVVQFCDFYSSGGFPQDSLFARIEVDTSNIYRVDPEYIDPNAGEFHLAPASQLVDKGSTGGALGAYGIKWLRKTVR